MTQMFYSKKEKKSSLYLSESLPNTFDQVTLVLCNIHQPE